MPGSQDELDPSMLPRNAVTHPDPDLCTIRDARMPSKLTTHPISRQVLGWRARSSFASSSSASRRMNVSSLIRAHRYVSVCIIHTSEETDLLVHIHVRSPHSLNGTSPELESWFVELTMKLEGWKDAVRAERFCVVAIRGRVSCARNTSQRWTAMSATPTPAFYVAFCAIAVTVLKAVNEEVTEPYMVRSEGHVSRPSAECWQLQDEPFHVPQAQAYCKGDYWSWDPKITTPPGLYVGLHLAE